LGGGGRGTDIKQTDGKTGENRWMPNSRGYEMTRVREKIIRKDRQSIEKACR
jgi:hypothetical protein